jgi:hypothetical protein
MAIEASRRRAEQADIQISQFELREIIVGSFSVGAESNSGLCICVITEHKRRAYNDLSQFKLGLDDGRSKLTSKYPNLN